MKTKYFFYIVLASFFTYTTLLHGQKETSTSKQIFTTTAITQLQKQLKLLDSGFIFYNNPTNYKSIEQGFAYKIRLNGLSIEEANTQIVNGISWADFLTKFPDAMIDTLVYICKQTYTSNEHTKYLHYQTVGTDDQLDYGISTTLLAEYESNIQHKWLVEYFPTSANYEGRLMAYYFPKNLQQFTLPLAYQNLIHYADYLCDTAFNLDMFPLLYEPNIFENEEDFTHLTLNEKKELLEKLLHTQVIGSCSMDTGPLDHVLSIAKLAAEIGQWNAFIHAYFRYVNQNVLRVASSNFASFKMEQDIMNFEKIMPQPFPLILGTCLSISNPLPNRLSTFPERMGVLLSHLNNKEHIGTLLIECVQDNDLDLYNRINILSMFIHFINQLQDNSIKEKILLNMDSATLSMPVYLQDIYTKWRQ